VPYRDPEAQRAYQREWCRRRRAEFLAGRSCAQCGATEDLEFHHVDPETKLSHRIWSWSKARIRAELAKCVVLCDPCHNDLHMTARYGGEAQLSVFGGAV
jgi:5-methylcytosine-specific restriction endonuclease McrA